MEVDTGAALSLIRLATYHALWPQDQTPPLKKTDVKLKSYAKTEIHVKGTIDVEVEYQGKVTIVTAKIFIDATAKPRFCKARPVPYTLQAKVETEINQLVKQGVLEPVQFFEWATPVVLVLSEMAPCVFVVTIRLP